jgi:hypothetical protein
VNITVTVNLTERLQSVLDSLSDSYIEDAAQGAYDFLRDYHKDMQWRGSNWIPRSSSGQFAQSVADSWQQPMVAGDSATIRNTFGLLAWKVTGGEITPKRAKALTIPLTTTARSRAARDFPGLFRLGQTLSKRLGRRIEAQYALSRGVTQRPWPGALPPDEQVADAATAAVLGAMEKETAI